MIYILHQVNCQGAFGAGFAKEIANRWPQARQDYIDGLKQGAYLGDFIASKVSNECTIVHLYGQEYYGNGKKSGKCFTDYDALENSIKKFKESYPNSNAVCPKFIGCGLAGGDWQKVENILNKYQINYSENIDLDAIKNFEMFRKKNQTEENEKEPKQTDNIWGL